MGKQKEMYMQMQQEELAQQEPSINQLNNNKMTKKQCGKNYKNNLNQS